MSPFKDPEKRRQVNLESQRRRREKTGVSAPQREPEPSPVRVESPPSAPAAVPSKPQPPKPPAPPPVQVSYFDQRNQKAVIDDPELRAKIDQTQDYQKAKEVADRTKHYFLTRGWVLWKCTKLNNEIIVVVRDYKVTGYPKGYPVFSDDEIRQLNQDGATPETWELVIEAKKDTDVRVEA